MTPTQLRGAHEPPPGPVLDVHVHPSSGFGPYRDVTPAEDVRHLLAAADRAHVTHLVLFSLHPECPRCPTPAQFTEANDLCGQARDEAPQRLLPFCYVNPQYPDEACAEIDRRRQADEFVGVKLWVALRASDPRVIQVVDHATRLGLPVLQHAWVKTTGNLEGESTPADVAKLARAVPDAKIIMAHLNGHGLRGLERVASCTNVLVDTAGGDPEAGMVDSAVARLGYRRVVFGSDAPIRHFGVQMGKILSSQCSPEHQRAMLWDNAVGLMPPWACVHQQGGA